VRRREVILLFGAAAAAWPLVGNAQPSTPVIAFLSRRSRDLLIVYLLRGAKASELPFVLSAHVFLGSRVIGAVTIWRPFSGEHDEGEFTWTNNKSEGGR
jgi:hypothetical protein